MRDSHRTALGDLVPEAGNDRTVRAQHIPEARGDETRLPRRAALLDRQTQRLHIDLRKGFVQPITFVGFTALSVEIITIFSTSYSMHLSATLRVPATFTRTASHGFSSISGTCL